MFILVNPRKHGGHCPPKSHGQGAHGTQPFSCLFFSSQPCAFQMFGFSIFICLSVDSDLFSIQAFYRYPRISSLSNHANRHTAPQWPKWIPSGTGTPEEISKSDTGATRASRRDHWFSPLRHLLPTPGIGTQGTQGTQKLRAQFLRHLRHLRHWFVVPHLHQPLSVASVAAEGHTQLPKLFPPTVHQLF